MPISPVYLNDIQAKQAKDRDLRLKIKTNPSHFQKTVVEQVKVVTYKDRIYVPKDEIRQFVKQCPNCQRFKKKKKKKKYGKLPPKNIELIPWDTVCISHWLV